MAAQRLAAVNAVVVEPVAIDRLIAAELPAARDGDRAAYGRIVAGCQYKRDGKMNLQPQYEPAAHELASAVASSGYEPDPAWVLDICRTADDRFHLLEIGGFSFADLYVCDKRAIVEAVSASAAREWERADGAVQGGAGSGE